MAAKLKDGIFLGDYEAAQDLEFIVANKITHIINCVGREIPNSWERTGVRYLTFHWPESGNCVIFDENNSVLDDIYAFVEEAHLQAESTLIHSIDGASRGTFCACLYFMLKYKWSLNKTLVFLQSKRPDLCPRPGFMRQLRALDASLQRVVRSQQKCEDALKRFNEWDPNTISVKPSDTGANPGDYDHDELLLAHTFLNSQSTQNTRLWKGLKQRRDTRSSPTRAKNNQGRRRVQWIDDPSRKNTSHTEIPRSPKTQRPTTERPATPSYNSLKPVPGWNAEASKQRPGIKGINSLVGTTSKTSHRPDGPLDPSNAPPGPSILKGSTIWEQQQRSSNTATKPTSSGKDSLSKPSSFSSKSKSHAATVTTSITLTTSEIHTSTSVSTTGAIGYGSDSSMRVNIASDSASKISVGSKLTNKFDSARHDLHDSYVGHADQYLIPPTPPILHEPKDNSPGMEKIDLQSPTVGYYSNTSFTNSSTGQTQSLANTSNINATSSITTVDTNGKPPRSYTAPTAASRERTLSRTSDANDDLHQDDHTNNTSGIALRPYTSGLFSSTVRPQVSSSTPTTTTNGTTSVVQKANNSDISLPPANIGRSTSHPFSSKDIVLFTSKDKTSTTTRNGQQRVYINSSQNKSKDNKEDHHFSSSINHLVSPVARNTSASDKNASMATKASGLSLATTSGESRVTRGRSTTPAVYNHRRFATPPPKEWSKLKSLSRKEKGATPSEKSSNGIGETSRIESRDVPPGIRLANGTVSGQTYISNANSSSFFAQRAIQSSNSARIRSSSDSAAAEELWSSVHQSRHVAGNGTVKPRRASSGGATQTIRTGSSLRHPKYDTSVRSNDAFKKSFKALNAHSDMPMSSSLKSSAHQPNSSSKWRPNSAGRSSSQGRLSGDKRRQYESVSAMDSMTKPISGGAALAALTADSNTPNRRPASAFPPAQSANSLSNMWRTGSMVDANSGKRSVNRPRSAQRNNSISSNGSDGIVTYHHKQSVSSALRRPSSAHKSATHRSKNSPSLRQSTRHGSGVPSNRLNGRLSDSDPTRRSASAMGGSVRKASSLKHRSKPTMMR